MFLSTENPTHDHPLPSTSPSSSFLHFTTSSDELGQTHLYNFSIRDYAYSNRRKNNWPFSLKSLQFCSSHGVTDPLPPFQNRSNVSNQFQTTARSSPGKQTVPHVHIRGSDSAKLGLNQTGTSVSKSKVETVVAAAGTSNNNKKCGRGGMVKSKEDTCGGGLVMTTTTCPICKTFSSASNTTLNAHIDQCLSVDSAVAPVSSTKPNKARGKPRMKVKTLVDIYAYAKVGTLEDLDERNGTKWASRLSHTNQVVADESEVSKKRKVSPVGVGPVYIDAKGQKLRILTEFIEKKTCTSTSTTWREQHEDGSKENSKSSRKRRRGKKHYKYLKLTNLKANTSEIPEYQRVFYGEGSSTNQRMLSKRGLISKKLNERGHKSYASRDQPSEDDDDEDSWSGGERVVLRGTDSSPLNKQKLRTKVSGRKKTMSGSKGAQSHSFRGQMSGKEVRSFARTHLDTVQLKKSLASIQEDKYSLEKNVREVSTSMRKLSVPFVANGWRRQSLPLELKKARLDSSEEEEGELSDDDYVSGDDNPSFSRYDDDDDEESSDEEEDDSSNSRVNVLDKSNDATPSNETIPSERAMYYSQEDEYMIYAQTTCEEDVRFGSEVRGKGSLFVEVDTIPIPGPPGSFLPSPRDMWFDDNLGNSSVITSQLQSSDRNSSESPVSNFAAGNLSFCVPSHHETISQAELITVDKTTNSPRFRSNDRESGCCCQRKERISEGIALNHQASHLLLRRAMNDPNHHPFEQSPYMIQQELDLQSKFSNRAVVPPSPNPVFRLMGKDLMVMNQGEASRESLKPPTQFLDPPPCAGTGLYFKTGLSI